MKDKYNPEKKFRFRNFAVYKNARSFCVRTKRLSESFPKQEQFALKSQLWRALDSIILNIAEGSDRGTDKDFAHFLNLSSASLNEVVACIDVAFDCGYINKNEQDRVINEAALLFNELTAFRNHVLKSPTK